MELIARGWHRNRGETTIAKIDLAEATVGPFRESNKSDSTTYITSTPRKTRVNPQLGCELIREEGHVDICFHKRITLNAECLIRLTLTRKDIAQLFLLQNQQGINELIGSVRKFEACVQTRPSADEEWAASEAPSFEAIMFKKVEELALRTYVTKSLKDANIDYIGELVQKTEHALRRSCRELRIGFHEIKTAIENLGLNFGMRLPGWPPFKPTLLQRIDEFDGDLAKRLSRWNIDEGMDYVGDLVVQTEEVMLRYLGPEKLNEIQERLTPMGLGIGMEVNGWRLGFISQLAELFEKAATEAIGDNQPEKVTGLDAD